MVAGGSWMSGGGRGRRRQWWRQWRARVEAMAGAKVVLTAGVEVEAAMGAAAVEVVRVVVKRWW